MASLKNFLTLGLLALPCALSTACGSDDPAEIIEGDEDVDGDGFSPNQGDCNDLDNNVNPEAPDPCDGIDQNRNGPHKLDSPISGFPAGYAAIDTALG